MISANTHTAPARKVFLVFWATYAVLLALAGSAIAQNEPLPAPTATAPPEQDISVAPVIVDGEEIFQLRGFSVLPAERRAEQVQRRIIAVASEDDGPIAVDVEENEFGLAVVTAGRLLTVTTQADADFEQIELDLLAALHAQAIEEAIVAYRESRTEDARIDSALVAAGWTGAFLILTLIFRKMRLRTAGAIEAFVVRRFSNVEEATKALVKGQAVGRLARFATNIVLWAGYFVAFYYYLTFVLLSFAETRTIAEILLTYVTQPLFDILVGFVGYTPNLITLVIIAIVTRFLVRALKLFMDNIEAGTLQWDGFEPHWVAPTYNIIRILIIMIALVFAYPHIPGSDSRAFQGLTILAGIMVSLGSNTVVSNMMAGLFVIYRRSTNIGDRIRVGEQVGDVIEIKLMETLIKSVKNEMISIPNAQLLNSEVVNYSREIDGRGLLVHTTVGIGYEEPREKIEAMLVEAALRTPDLKPTPAPFVLCTALADYAVNYQINGFTTRGSRLPQTLSNLHRNIIDVFNENGVQIMTPSYESDPEELKIATEPWDGILAQKTTSA